MALQLGLVSMVQILDGNDPRPPKKELIDIFYAQKNSAELCQYFSAFVLLHLVLTLQYSHSSHSKYVT